MRESDVQVYRENAERPPRSLIEHLAGNCRPWPALPAGLVLAISLMPVLRADGIGDTSAWLAIAVAGGLTLSCALAIAAGFCSLVPQAVWLAGAFWALSLLRQGLLPSWYEWVLYPGLVAVLAMIGIQIWRIITGRFVPTVVD